VLDEALDEGSLARLGRALYDHQLGWLVVHFEVLLFEHLHLLLPLAFRRLLLPRAASLLFRHLSVFLGCHLAVPGLPGLGVLLVLLVQIAF
jgi:hypothetical protein